MSFVDGQEGNSILVRQYSRERAVVDGGIQAEGAWTTFWGFEINNSSSSRTVAAHDRAGLERLCSYGLRAPFSQERLSLLADGRVRYRLRRPWPTPDGATEIVLDPVKFLKRLTALMARPYANLVRYYGVFANRSNDRTRLTLPPSMGPEPESLSEPLPESASPSDPQPSADRPRRTGWARLLKRVLHLDALTCPRCRYTMVVLALISDPAVVHNILNHLHLPSHDPPRSPPHSAPESPEPMTLEPEHGEKPGDDPFPSFTPQQRGPQ